MVNEKGVTFKVDVKLERLENHDAMVIIHHLKILCIISISIIKLVIYAQVERLAWMT